MNPYREQHRKLCRNELILHDGLENFCYDDVHTLSPVLVLARIVMSNMIKVMQLHIFITVVPSVLAFVAGI